MKELKEPFKKDNNNIWYIDFNDVKLEQFRFHEIGKLYNQEVDFFKIDSVNDYIIKDTTKHPILFNRTKTMNILKKLQSKQDLFDDIDFSVGYCKDRLKLIGTIIPYYEGATSLRSFIYLHRLCDLEKFYYHDSYKIDNLISLFLDILDLLSRLYEKNIIYLDVHSGNFLFYKNSIKIIDFEPNYVLFCDKNNKYYEILIRNYTMLIELICRKLGFENILLNPGETFMETENKVKLLRKEL